MLEDTRRYQKIPEVQYNSQTKKKKTTDNRLQNTTQNTKD